MRAFSYARSLPVTWQRWRPRHSIRYIQNPMLHSNFMALCFIEPELLPIEVLHCGNVDFRPFCFCDLDLDPMTFIYDLKPYSFQIYRMRKYKLPMSRLSKVIDWQTDRHNRNYIPRLFAGISKFEHLLQRQRVQQGQVRSAEAEPVWYTVYP